MDDIGPDTSIKVSSRMSQQNNNTPSRSSEPAGAKLDLTMEQVRMLNPYQRTVRSSTRNQTLRSAKAPNESDNANERP